MKKLILLRHGKSSWEFNVPDEERILQQRAYRDADVIAKAFQEKTDYRFSIWSSKAVRATTTAELVREHLKDRVDDFQIKEEFYTFDGDKLLSLIYNLPDEVDQMMLVGHNPAFTQLINFFCEKVRLDNLPTTGLAEMHFEATKWSQVDKAKLNLILFPKNLI